MMIVGVDAQRTTNDSEAEIKRARRTYLAGVQNVGVRGDLGAYCARRTRLGPHVGLLRDLLHVWHRLVNGLQAAGALQVGP